MSHGCPVDSRRGEGSARLVLRSRDKPCCSILQLVFGTYESRRALNNKSHHEGAGHQAL